MSLRYHSAPRDLHALAMGGGDPDAIRELTAGQYSKNFIVLRAVLKDAWPGRR